MILTVLLRSQIIRPEPHGTFDIRQAGRQLPACPPGEPFSIAGITQLVAGAVQDHTKFHEDAVHWAVRKMPRTKLSSGPRPSWSSDTLVCVAMILSDLTARVLSRYSLYVASRTGKVLVALPDPGEFSELSGTAQDLIRWAQSNEADGVVARLASPCPIDIHLNVETGVGWIYDREVGGAVDLRAIRPETRRGAIKPLVLELLGHPTPSLSRQTALETQLHAQAVLGGKL